MPTQWSRLDCRHNLEGFLVFQEGEPPAEWYAQVYRTGIVEFVASNFVSGNNGFRWIPGNGFEELILDYVTRVLSTLLRCGVSPPVVILLTLIHVEGVHLSIEREIHGRDTREPFDRSIISIPELVLETVEGDISKGMKPLFDALWNASGWPKSPCYDAAGNRIRNSGH